MLLGEKDTPLRRVRNVACYALYWRVCYLCQSLLKCARCSMKSANMDAHTEQELAFVREGSTALPLLVAAPTCSLTADSGTH